MDQVLMLAAVISSGAIFGIIAGRVLAEMDARHAPPAEHMLQERPRLEAALEPYAAHA